MRRCPVGQLSISDFSLRFNGARLPCGNIGRCFLTRRIFEVVWPFAAHPLAVGIVINPVVISETAYPEDPHFSPPKEQPDFEPLTKFEQNVEGEISEYKRRCYETIPR